MVGSPVDLTLVDEDSSTMTPYPPDVHVLDRWLVPRSNMHIGRVPEGFRHGARVDVSPLEILGLYAAARRLSSWCLSRERVSAARTLIKRVGGSLPRHVVQFLDRLIIADNRMFLISEVLK